MKRLTFEEIVEKARRVHGDKYDYLSDRMDGRYRKLTIRCKSHGEFEQTWTNHSLGKGCRKCAIAINSNKLMHSLEDVRKLGNKLFCDKYTYLDILRVPTDPRLRLACPHHGLFEQNLYSHLAGKGCFSCSVERSLDSDEAILIKAAKIHGVTYRYLAITKGNPRQLTINCKTHGLFTQSVFGHLQGNGCPKCGKAEMADKSRWTLEELNRVNTTPWEIVRLAYIRGRAEAVAVCEIHGEFTKPTDKLLGGSGCPKCSFEIRSENAKQTLEEYTVKASAVHNNAYTYESLERSGSYPKVIANCAKHGDFLQGMAGHLAGSRCPACANTLSKVGTEFAEYVKELSSDSVLEGSLPSSRYRWDVLVPSKKLAFEFHGLYWHSTEHKPANYHLDKHTAGLLDGYRTIHIYEDEWQFNQGLVKALIANSLNISNKEKHFARKCRIKPVNSDVAREFLRQYHIQGGCSGSAIGLFYDETLVAVIVYSLKESGRKGSSSDRLEILRYATSSNVAGGFSKLLKEILKIETAVKTVVTFSDDRLFTGNMYSKAGFKVAGKLRPDYFYVRYGKRQHKRGYQKSRFASDPKLAYVEGYTERQLAELNNLYKVYDCGKTRWEMCL